MRDLDQVKRLEKATLEESNYNSCMKMMKIIFYIDPKSFEQVEIKKDLIGEKGKLVN